MERMRLDAIAASFHEQNDVAMVAQLHRAATLRFKWMRDSCCTRQQPRTLRTTHLPSNSRTATMLLNAKPYDTIVWRKRLSS